MNEDQEFNPLFNPDNEVYLLHNGYIFKNELDRLLSSENQIDKKQLKSIVVEAASKEDYGFLITLLNKGYQLSVLNDKNQTLLHLIYYNNSQGILSANRGQAFSHYKNYAINYIDSNGLSHLHIACAAGHIDMIKQYLDNGEDIHARLTADCDGDRNGFTPFHFAVAHHKIEVVKLLLERGADIHATDSSGSTPLHVACTVSRDFVKSLNSEVLKQNTCWATELDILKLLLEHYSDVNLRDVSGNTPLFKIFNNDYYYYCPTAISEVTDHNFFKKGELARSLRERQLEKFRLLFQPGTDMTVKNFNDESILHCIIKDLTTARDANLPVAKYTFDKIYAEVVQLLLKTNKGLDANAKNKESESPIVLAVSLISYHIVKVLLDYNVNVNDINIDKHSFFKYPNIVLNALVIINLEKIISALVDRGWKLTPMHHLVIMKFLAHDVDDCDCEFGYYNKIIPECVGYLLYFGSPTHTKRIFMKTYASSNKILKEKLLMSMQLFLEISKLAQYPLTFDEEFLELLYTPDYLAITDITDYKNDVSLLKSGSLNNGMNLYDFLMKPPSIAHISMYFIHGDKAFGVEQEFKEPYFKLLIYGHFVKSMVRIYIESSAEENYIGHLLPSLPNLCHKIILEFLNNEDILRLCEAVLLQ